MNCLSEFQLKAGKEVVCGFEEGLKPWHLLFAQPQSGKTDTFFFVGAEMLRLKKVSNVVIVCGADDKQLKKQCIDSFCDVQGGMDFCEKYDFYLENSLELGRNDRFEVKSNMKSNIHFIWGNDLTNTHPYSEKTLFIWEESHYAESINMRPFKFFQNVGISCDGDPVSLSNKNNYVLSVSATPFSELSHILNSVDEPLKGKTFLETSEEYHGISNVIQKNLIHSFNSQSLQSELATILKSTSLSKNPSFGIIRVNSEKKSSIVASIAKVKGWNVLRCNADVKKREINNFDILKTKPSKSTLIIIKGMCRMGQVLNKQFLSFVMETSFDSNTETLIQGLLGRTLGWHSYSINVYINDMIMTRNDTGRYIDLLDGGTELPKKARNLRKNGVSSHCDAFCGKDELPIRKQKSETETETETESNCV